MAFVQLFTTFSGLWPPYVAPELKRPAGRTSSDNGSTNSVDSKKGRRVESHSTVPTEREVMFDKFTRFEVREGSHRGNGAVADLHARALKS